MDTETQLSSRHTTSGANIVPSASRALFGCLFAISAVGFPIGSTTSRPLDPSHDTKSVVAAPHESGVREGEPDLVADHAGGTAARLHDADGAPIAGDVFLLIGPRVAAPNARVYETTPYTHDRGVHPDTVASNLVANQIVRTITGSDLELIEMTHAPGGGPSGGLARAIAYLDVASDGEFTGGLRVAATGQLSIHGHIGAIDDIDAKTAAAHLAEVDVLFTPTLPTSETLLAYSARLVGEIARDPSTGSAFNDPRRIDTFRRWGAERPTGMDVVDARHLIDVSAYLCGTGSRFACQITESLDRQAQQRLDELTAGSSAELRRLHAASIAPG